MLAHAIAVTVLLAAAQTEPADTPAASSPPPVAAPVEGQPAVGTPADATAAKPALPDVGSWLVHLARHQGHLVGRADPRSASLHVMALLKAAVDVSPDCGEAYYWLYDLEHRMGREGGARKALAEYVRLTPGDDTARIRHFEIELQNLQTTEARAGFVAERLKRKPLSRTLESELHRWLARHYYERSENEFSVRELEHALRLNPMNVPARELAYEMFGETEPSLQRVEMALQLISINPSQANLVWDLAEFLDRLSLHGRAQEWYNRAIELHSRANSGQVPAEFRHKLAISYVSGRDFERAKRAADEALKADPAMHTARLLRAHVLSKLGRADEAAADIAHVAAAYAARIDAVIEKKDFDAAAEIAWFYCYHQPKPDVAMKMATLAMEDAEPSSLAKVAYGFALRLSGRIDDAIVALKPLAATDQLASFELARAQIAQGRKAAAMTTLHKAATAQYSGIAYGLICDLMSARGETPPKPPLNTKVIAALDRFKRDVFDYYRTPEKFLQFTMYSEDSAATPTGPISVRFRLENVGPFPITFGDGYMARPLVSLSIKPAGGESYDNAIQVMMNARPVLLPGDAFEKTVAIDVGPIRQRLLATVTEPQRIEITAMLDPVFESGALARGMGTIVAGPIYISRSALDVSPEGITTLLDRVQSPDIADRVAAAEQLGAILCTVHAGPSAEAMSTIPVDRIRTALAELLGDDAWQVRARALVAAGGAPLDSRVTVAAAPRVRAAPDGGQEHPVVKLLAVRLFAEQHGKKFHAVLEQLGKSDPTDYVRMMATSYLPPVKQASAAAAE